MPPALELALAAALPIALFAMIATRLAALGPLRVVGILVACIWAAPYVATTSTPVGLDYLATEFPHKALAPEGFLPSNPLINDVPLQFLPWREAVREAILSGELPVLDRHSAAGTPLLANPQAGVFYLPNLISLPLTTFAWPLFVSVTKLLVGLAGTFLFLRRRDLGIAASQFGAIAYTFSTFTSAFLMFPHTNVTTLFPWLLLAIDSVVECDDRRPIGAASLVTAMVLAAGHPESAFHCALVAIPYGVFRAFRLRSRAAFIRLAAAGVLGAAIAAVALLPFIAYVPHTQRIHDIESIPGFLSTPELDRAALVTLAVPNYYGNPRVHNYRHPLNYNELATQYAGLATLVLALLGALRRWPQRTFWIVTAAAAFLLANQLPHIGEFLNQLPLLDITAHGRLRFVFLFALAVLAAHGLELAAAQVFPRRILAIAAGLAVAVICVLSYPVFAEFGVRRLIFFTTLGAFASLLPLLPATMSERMKHAIVALLFVDLFSVVGYYNPAVGREWFYPATEVTRPLAGARIAGIDRAVMPNSAIFFDASDVRPHDPMAFRPYVAVLDAIGLDRSHYFPKFNDVPPRPALDFLGVRKVAAPPGLVSPLPMDHSGSDGVVFDNPTALPRFFAPSRVEQSPNPASSLAGTTDGHVVFSRQSAPVAPRTRVTVEKITASTAVIRVDAPAASFVASNEPSLPGWRIARGDQDVAWETINGAFVGWRVPRGSGVYTLRYIPPGLVPGALVSLLGLLVAAALLARRKPAAR